MSTLPRRLRGRQAGLSLIELMISITIGLIILAGVAYVFANTSEARRELERTSRQLENGRFAIDLLSDDLRLAGFVGELNVASLSAGTVPATAVPAALPDPCSVAAGDWNSAIHLHLQGYYTGTGAPAACLPAGLNVLAGTDILVVRRARTCFAGSAGCGTVDNGKPYIQVSLCSGVPTTHDIGLQGTAAFALKKKDCTAAADKRQYYVHIYYVSTDNGAGANVPTLKRLTFTPGSAATATSPANFTVDPLVEGIEQFHVEYGLDTDAAGTAGYGTPDVYVNDPNDYPAGACLAACQVANWRNVVTAHVYVVSRGLEATPGYADAKTYQLGTVTYTPASGEARTYRRHAYSALVRITNPAGRRDTP
ncbi:MAG: PilW family protein [Pseudomonadota bacterium]